MTTSSSQQIEPGTVVRGKWRGRQYRIERLLGEGTGGKVYLARHRGLWVALKVGASSAELQSEINALSALAGQRNEKQPYLLDSDDMVSAGQGGSPFYAMRYIAGQTAANYLHSKGNEWFPLVGLQLLRRLGALHQAGWCFGDLKVENVMVSGYGQVELVDYGGATVFGKSVRQFTELYDRGYWNAGSRTADAAYDLFSFAVLCIQLHAPIQLQQLASGQLPQTRSTDDLLKLAASIDPLKPAVSWLARALAGKFGDGASAANQWQQLLHFTPPKTGTGSGAVPLAIKLLAGVSLAALTAVLGWLAMSL